MLKLSGDAARLLDIPLQSWKIKGFYFEKLRSNVSKALIHNIESESICHSCDLFKLINIYIHL